MTLSEILEIKSLSTPVQITDPFELEQYLVINDLVPLKVSNISSSIDLSNPLPITKGGITKGYLISLKSKKDIEIDNMTDLEFISFLVEANRDDFDNTHYRFEFDYAVINSDYFLDYYQNYMHNSALWGGFVHVQNGQTANTPYIKSFASIELGNEIQHLDNFSIESATRAVHQPFAFERFLKMYHLLELQFDYITVQKIQGLSYPQDINQLGKILSDYESKELSRLTDLIKTKCTDVSKLESVLINVIPYKTVAEDVFVTFGKSNYYFHLPNSSAFHTVMNIGSFSTTALSNNGIPGYNSAQHDEFILNLTAYWIYRIRCSIAHNKIGEYILTWDKEDFVVEFAEPLIKEVLLQYFKK